MDDPMAHVTTAGGVIYALEWLKRHGWLDWAGPARKTVARAISYAMAVLIGLGLYIEGGFYEGWIIEIPAGPQLLAASLEAIKQLVTQQLLYDGAVGQKVLKP